MIVTILCEEVGVCQALGFYFLFATPPCDTTPTLPASLPPSSPGSKSRHSMNDLVAYGEFEISQGGQEVSGGLIPLCRDGVCSSLFISS